MKAKLWWLTGFPDGPAWVVIPLQGDRGIEVRSLKPADLRRATRAVSKLAGEFPRALPAIVGDADEWVTATRAVLDALKPWVHRGERPPADLFEQASFYPDKTRAHPTRLRRDAPGRDLIAALSWVLATRRADARSYLRWIEDHADALSVVLARMGRQDALAFAVQTAHLGVTLGRSSSRRWFGSPEVQRSTSIRSPGANSTSLRLPALFTPSIPKAASFPPRGRHRAFLMRLSAPVPG
jgi:hypothetical protein